MTRLLIRTALIVTVLPLGIVACSGNETVADDEVETVAYEVPRYDPDEVICKRQRPVGSHVPVRVCKTRAQIDREREAMYRRYGEGAPEMGDLPPPPPSPSSPR